MATQQNKEVRRAPRPNHAEGGRSAERSSLEETQRAVQSEVLPGVGSLEVGVGVDKVLPSESSERAGENKQAQVKRRQDAALKRKQSAAARRQKLITSKPPAKKMVSQITGSLVKEEKKLKKEERLLRRNAVKSASRLNAVVQRLRELHQLISSLADMAYESLKRLWLKVVHGIV